MSLKTIGIIVLVLLGVVGLFGLRELLRKNRVIETALNEAELRNKAYENYIHLLDSSLREKGIIADSLKLVGDGLKLDLEIHTDKKIQYVKKTVPNYVDVMSYSDEQKRDSISSVTNRLPGLRKEFYRVLQGDSIK